MRMVKKKIADYRFNGLVRRFLKSSTVKSDGSLQKNNCGDDAVFFFKKENNAKDFMLQFKVRIEAFGLSLNMDKTSFINQTLQNLL